MKTKKASKASKTAPITIQIEPGDIRKYCLERDGQMFDNMISGLDEIPPGAPMEMREFAAMMILQCLIETGKHILRTEWDLAHEKPEVLKEHGRRWKEELKEYFPIFQHQYAAVQKALGPHFQEFWDKAVETQNFCAKTNIGPDGKNGFDYVFPKFNPDGTHEPVGPKDGPWEK